MQYHFIIIRLDQFHPNFFSSLAMMLIGATPPALQCADRDIFIVSSWSRCFSSSSWQSFTVCCCIKQTLFNIVKCYLCLSTNFMQPFFASVIDKVKFVCLVLRRIYPRTPLVLARKFHTFASTVRLQTNIFHQILLPLLAHNIQLAFVLSVN